MPRPVHLEIAASDPQTLITFYESVFGWTFAQWGGLDYWVISTGDEPDGINGGLTRRQGPTPPADAPLNGAVPVIGVGDCALYHQRALDAGAVETSPVTQMPGVGTLAYFRDPDNNHFGIIEPMMPA